MTDIPNKFSSRQTNTSAGSRSKPTAKKGSRLRRFVGRSLESLRRTHRQIVRFVDTALVNWAGVSTFRSRLYYALWSSEFGRENQAVLAGRSKYERINKQSAGTSAMLRRNIHRIEKGLVMRPRRNQYATEYIGETVNCYRIRIENGGDSDAELRGELQWAFDVLTKYFEVTADSRHPSIDQARTMFSNLPNPTDVCRCSDRDFNHFVPYRRDLSQEPSVSIGHLLRLSERRRSVRWFLQDPVERDRIDQAILVARQSPSACNRQPFQFRVFDDPDVVQEVASISMGTAGYVHNIPVLAAVVGRLDAYCYERDRHLIYIDGSLAAMAFVLGLEAQGLSSCCINWPDVSSMERRISDVLELEAQERVVMLIAIGYPDPDGMVPFSQKKPLSQLRRYNFE